MEKNMNINSSNSLAFGRWPQTKIFELAWGPKIWGLFQLFRIRAFNFFSIFLVGGIFFSLFRIPFSQRAVSSKDRFSTENKKISKSRRWLA